MLLLVVLVMAIVLTVVLSLASRTVTNIRTTQEEENSERAFSAAEAGIERSLTTPFEGSGILQNRTSYQTSSTAFTGIELLLNNGAPNFKDEAIDVWLTDYPGYTTLWSGDITLYWGKPSDTCVESELSNTMAALEIIVVSGSKVDPVGTTYAVDPCSQRASFNNFEYIPSGGGVVGGKTFAYKKTITVTSGLLIRTIPLYASTIFGAKGCNSSNTNCIALPTQGRLVQSVGIADDTQRKIVNFQGYPKLPTEALPFVLFSPR